MIKKMFLITCCALFLFFSDMTNISASEYTADTEWQDEISDVLEEHLTTYYNDIYTLSGFSVIYENVTETDTTLSADATVTVSMALNRDPAESPYVLGMKSAASEYTGTTEHETIQEIIDAYLAEVLPYYQVPYETAFSYHIDMVDGIQPQIYNCYFNGEEEPIYINIENDKVYQELFTFDDGIHYIDTLLTEPMPYGPISISGYNASSAVNYAIKHATDEPEFTGNGNSDCANFVSKCINAGNIPVDVAGKWYPASVWGNTNTCGINWMRTGANDGGIIPYFKGKGWLKTITVSEVDRGAIMFWNNKSHVAIVTYFDGSTIKFSQHSNTKMTNVYQTYNSSMDITFYEFR